MPKFGDCYRCGKPIRKWQFVLREEGRAHIDCYLEQYEDEKAVIRVEKICKQTK